MTTLTHCQCALTKNDLIIIIEALTRMKSSDWLAEISVPPLIAYFKDVLATEFERFDGSE